MHLMLNYTAFTLLSNDCLNTGGREFGNRKISGMPQVKFPFLIPLGIKKIGDQLKPGWCFMVTNFVLDYLETL